MNSISPEQLTQISAFTHTDRLRALVILNQFYWERFGRTYRNSADLLCLDTTQAQELIQKLDHEWQASL
ncbi:MAG: hypothetical protein H7Y22_00050 [Gemmatimonadaceae bacterium]|nr:hypothetical protein [Gloeobacterales cyanobacterium ES-bin-141]